MRALTLLVLLATTAHAADPEPPARVEAHDLTVVVDGSGRLSTTQTWRVHVDRPAGASAGLPAPAGLDGATSGGATVFDDLLILPQSAAPGAVYTLAASARGRRGPGSGVFESAPDLPLTVSTVRVQAPPWIPATVWFDPAGAPQFERTRSARAVEVRWEQLDGATPAALVWTTWKSWEEAGEALSALVAPKLADKRGLGRGIAQDIDGISVAEIVSRINRIVTVYPDDHGTWDTARPAAQVLAEGRGTSAERGVAMLSMLRAAGYDARPALFRPPGPGGAPLVVPAPAQLTRPAVAVISPKRVLWVDLSSAYTALPDLPAAMIGGVAWVPGSLPLPLGAEGPMDGLVTLNAQLRLGTDGEVSWTAQVSATGTGREWLRARLAPLSDEARVDALRRIVSHGRPALSRFSVTVTGLEDPQRPLRITLQGHETSVVDALGAGATAQIATLAAPGLAAWLPPRILVHEELSIEPPPGLQPIATVPSAPAFHPEVLLTQVIRRDSGRIVLTTEAMRPDRNDTPARATEAARFLEAHATDGPRIAWFALPTPPQARVLASDPRLGTVAERAALEALWWLSAADVTRARNALIKALKSESPVAVARALRDRTPPDQAGPWRSLYEAGKSPAVRIEAVEGLLAAGATREAWLGAAALSADPDPALRVRALGVMYRAQPEQRPDERSDRPGHAAWAPRQDLLTRAQEAAAATGRDASFLAAPIVITRARRDLDHDRTEEALALLEGLDPRDRDPVAEVLIARARVRLGVPSQDLAASIRASVQAAPFDARLLGEAARAMADVGLPDEALKFGLAAARLAGTDAALWAATARYAISHGDLVTATYAARRASDLAPADPQHGEALREIATWAGDAESAALGAARVPGGGKERPAANLDAILEHTPPEALLAVLQHHEDEVLASARWLAMRAQLRLDAGALDAAARDGVLLATRHGDPRGTGLAFAATAGRLWTSSGLDALASAVHDPTVRGLRMEYALITLDGDPLLDARALASDDPRAEALLRAAKEPAALAADVPGWPADLRDPEVAGPKGWMRNALLGAPDGVVAWSHPDQAAAVLFVDAPDNVLPPPLASLWTPRDRDEATLPDGGRLVRLDGGTLPLFAASQPLEGRRVWAVGFTPEAARRALALAGETWRVRR